MQLDIQSNTETNKKGGKTSEEMLKRRDEELLKLQDKLATSFESEKNLLTQVQQLQQQVRGLRERGEGGEERERDVTAEEKRKRKGGGGGGGGESRKNKSLNLST